MSTLTLKGLSKSFGELEVISGIDLTVEEGEFVALVGPSGCGKSTILRMIAGLEAPTSGSIIMDDKEVNRASPRDRNIAMVFQNYALYPHMTVRQNMGLNLKVSGVSGKEIERKVTDAAKLLDVSELLDRRPAQLSGGQRQRVAMGRAIVRNPAVFLFDEPLSNLDAALRVQMRAQIKLLHDKVRTTSIYVTHDQIEAMTLADRVVVLRTGRVEQQGRPIKLYEDPNNLFVATFIGSPAMNILDAEVVEDQGAPSLRLIDGTMLSLPETMRRRMGDAVQLGVRPEHLSMVHTHGDLVARLRYLEPTGAQTLMVLDIGDQQISVIVQGNVTAASGSMIHFSIPKDKRFLFDKETGERIRQDS